MGNRPVVLLIQRELVDERKNIIDTAAGEAVSRELDEQVRRLRGKSKIIQEEITKASRRGDEETGQKLEEKMRRLERQLERRQEGDHIRRLFDLTDHLRVELKGRRRMSGHTLTRI